MFECVLNTALFYDNKIPQNLTWAKIDKIHITHHKPILRDVFQAFIILYVLKANFLWHLLFKEFFTNLNKPCWLVREPKNTYIAKRVLMAAPARHSFSKQTRLKYRKSKKKQEHEK